MELEVVAERRYIEQMSGEHNLPGGNRTEPLAVRPRSGYTTPNVTDHTELQT